MIFNGLNAGGFASKGFIFEPPDFNNAQIGELNEFQDQLSILLASLSDNQRLQVQWYCDSDYQHELLRYNDETKRATNTWTRRARNERFARYWKAMTNRQLRRQRLILYISRNIETSPAFSASRGNLTKHYEVLLDQLEQEFAQVHETLTGIFSGQGARIIPMTDADHYRHFTAFLNPSLAERFNYDVLETFDPTLSMQENCWHCEGNGQADFGFWMDGYYHSTIVLTRWPKMTFPGVIHRLTNLRLLDYTITVNVDPIPIRKEITREEKAHERVAGDYASEKKLSLLTVRAQADSAAQLPNRFDFRGNEDALCLKKAALHRPLALAQAAAHFGGVDVRFGSDLAANGSQPFETVVVRRAGCLVGCHASASSSSSGVTSAGVA